jgi:hypothetical protein
VDETYLGLLIRSRPSLRSADGVEQATARATTEADSFAALRNDKQKDRQQWQGQKQNTGILHCVQDDDEFKVQLH